MTESIRVAGLRDFNKALKQVDADLPKETRLVLNDAADLVASGARSKVEKKTGKAARTVKAASTRTKARVKGGSKRIPYYPWLDFGGRVGRNRSIKRTYKKDGRYIYPTYRRARDSGEFVDMMAEGLTSLARKAGLDAA